MSAQVHQSTDPKSNQPIIQSSKAKQPESLQDTPDQKAKIADHQSTADSRQLSTPRNQKSSPILPGNQEFAESNAHNDESSHFEASPQMIKRSIEMGNMVITFQKDPLNSIDSAILASSNRDSTTHQLENIELNGENRKLEDNFGQTNAPNQKSPKKSRQLKNSRGGPPMISEWTNQLPPRQNKRSDI